MNTAFKPDVCGYERLCACAMAEKCKLNWCDIFRRVLRLRLNTEFGIFSKVGQFLSTDSEVYTVDSSVAKALAPASMDNCFSIVSL